MRSGRFSSVQRARHRSSARARRWVGFALLAVACGGGGNGGPAGPDPDPPGSGPLTGATLALLAGYLTDEARAGRLTLQTTVPVPALGAVPAALDAAIAADAGRGVTIVQVAPAALARQPITIEPGDLTVVSTAAAALAPADAEADAAIAAGVQRFKDHLQSQGLETAALQQAIDDTEFHEDGVQTDGESLLPPGASSIAFPIPLDRLVGGFDFMPVVITNDGHSHVVLRADVASLVRSEEGLGSTLHPGRLAVLEGLAAVVLEQRGLPDERGPDGRSASQRLAFVYGDLFEHQAAGPDPPEIREEWFDEIAALGPGAKALLAPFGIPVVETIGLHVEPSLAAGEPIGARVILQDLEGNPIQTRVAIVVEVDGIRAFFPGETGADGTAELSRQFVVPANARGPLRVSVRAPGLDSETDVVEIRRPTDATFVPAGDAAPGQKAAGFRWTTSLKLNVPGQSLAPAQDGLELDGIAPNGNLFVDEIGGVRRIFVDWADPANGILRIEGWDVLPPIERMDLGISSVRTVSAACPFVVRLFEAGVEVQVHTIPAPPVPGFAQLPILGRAFDRLDASIEGPACGGAFIGLVESVLVFEP